MLELGPEGHERSQGWVALLEARRLLASEPSDYETVLALARDALSHLRVGYLLTTTPGEVFLAARAADVEGYIEQLERRGGTAACYGTLLYSVDFLLRGSHFQTAHADAL